MEAISGTTRRRGRGPCGRPARRALLAAALLCAALPGTLHAQEAPAAPPADDPIARWLYPPDLIMRFNRDLGLTPDQREAITGAIEELQASLVDIQWRLMEASRALEDVLREPRVDEEAAQAAMAEVTGVENEVKQAHLRALVRIKNALTEEQQARLDDLRRRGRDRDDAAPGPAPLPTNEGGLR